MTGGYLIVRRAGVLWGLPAERVSTIERVAATSGPGFEIHLSGGDRFGVDAVLTLAADLRIHPASARLRRFLPADSAGLSLFAGEPLVLLVPTPPTPLSVPAPKAVHA